MPDSMESQLKQIFLIEATQIIEDAEALFLRLEQNPEDSSVIEALFRSAHNLKGSALAVGFAHVGSFTHDLESLLLQIKSTLVKVDSSLIDLLLRSCDYISRCIAQLKKDVYSELPRSPIADELQGYLTAATEPTSKLRPASPVAAISGFVEFEADVPEPSSPVSLQAAEPKLAPKAELSTSSGSEENIRVSLARLERLINLVGECVILQSVLKQQAQENSSTIIRTSAHQLGKVIKEVQDLSMSLRMMPIQQTFSKLQRIVRDTSKKLNKSVTMDVHGEDTEVDKTVLEKLSDPLVHLIRNAVDHGIESTSARLAAGKHPAAHISLSAYHHGGELVVEIRDDGGGIDPELLKAKAIKIGMIQPHETLTRQECLNLIYRPGFSTKSAVSDVSGRGVGMDVVRTNINNLQGEIELETEIGKGTCFRLRLPLTLAIIESMIVTSAGERFVIPLAHVLESVKAQQSDIHSAPGNGEIFILRGENLPMFRASQLLGLDVVPSALSDRILIILKSESGPLALMVDDIIGQQQVVIKQLGSEYEKLKMFSGSAILGDGRPALILEIAELLAKKRQWSLKLAS